ncbi:DUF3102 domain-containing protein [Desulfosporosinus sp.]|uniref:DUF3102 domain-containing protein n=1 Tax=Desulfosporosinus sp. TaxID=157907 RepID=UPI0025BCB787|nr:DUF3102 domain-containing protein [Desulfosporosinus sp.]MBC2724336.1 DUF3102 domain-containing protein [Desulfosporosinus sp.]MBC2726606.1 DUF3102 domain-containing protein [Desulfosporosinus sp.]
MNNVVNERTPQVIAAEINMIKHHTQKTVLTNAVEIGQRLTEAKALLKHGEWGQWLKESVSYSHSTATRLMQIYKEYGPKLLGLSEGDDSSNYATLHNLTYSQALILLGVPEEEREELVKDNDIENMSSRELQQTVNEKNQAIEDRDKAQVEKTQVIEEKEVLKKELDGKDREIASLTEQARDLEKQVEDFKLKYQQELDKVTEKQPELKEVAEAAPSAEKISELEEKLKTVQAKTSSISSDAQFSIHRENIRKAFDELLRTLTALAKTDPVQKEINRAAAQEMLQNMANMVKEWPPAIKTNLRINTSN